MEHFGVWASSRFSSFEFYLRGRDFLLHLYALILSVGILICGGSLVILVRGGSLVILEETLGFWFRLICIINLKEQCGIWFNSWDWVV